MSGSTGNESFVQLPPNGTGAVVDGFTVDPSGPLAPAFRQTVVLGDSAAADNVAAIDDQNRLTVHNADLGLLDLIAEDIAQADGSGPGLLKPPFAAADGSEPSLVVQISPLTPLQLDPSVPAVVGGVGPDGAVRRARVGTDGGLQLTDALVQTFTCGASGTVCVIDTAGYQSIAVQLTGTWAGTASFSLSNDQATWAPAVGIIPANNANIGASSTTSGLFNFAVPARYFRITFAYTSGLLVAVTALRAAPPLALSANIGYIGNYGVVQAANGVLAIGGNATTGTPVTSNPVPLGGADIIGYTRRIETDLNGVQIAAGILSPGFQVGVYNPAYTKYTTQLLGYTLSAQQSTIAPVMVGGLDQSNAARPLLTDSAGAALVGAEPSTPANQSITELLLQLVAIERVNAQYLYDIRAAMTATSPPDEPDVLLGDFMNPATSLSNMFN